MLRPRGASRPARRRIAGTTRMAFRPASAAMESTAGFVSFAARCMCWRRRRCSFFRTRLKRARSLSNRRGGIRIGPRKPNAREPRRFSAEFAKTRPRGAAPPYTEFHAPLNRDKRAARRPAKLRRTRGLPMTAIRFTRDVSLGSISAFALCLALGAPVALAQTTLPTIEVGRKTATPSAARAPVRAPAPKPKPAPVVARTAASAAPPQRAAGPAEGARRSSVELESLHREGGHGPHLRAARGSAGNRARPRRRPAQRRRQGQPIFSARLRARSRLRYWPDARRHAHQPDVARPQQRLCRRQFPDAGTAQRSWRFARGPITPRRAPSSRRWARSTCNMSTSCAKASSMCLAAVSLGPTRRSPNHGRWAMANCSPRSSGTATTARGSGPTKSARSTASRAGARAREENGVSITGMAYSNHYFATDQIPYTDVALGLMSRWGTEDPTDGGNASRYSLSARWSETNKNDWSRVEAFFIHNDTNLYDDFTYQLANPVTGLARRHGNRSWRSNPSVRPSPAIWLQPPAWLEI